MRHVASGSAPPDRTGGKESLNWPWAESLKLSNSGSVISPTWEAPLQRDPSRPRAQFLP